MNSYWFLYEALFFEIGRQGLENRTSSDGGRISPKSIVLAAPSAYRYNKPYDLYVKTAGIALFAYHATGLIWLVFSSTV